jgi:folate-binding protein YgfZ
MVLVASGVDAGLPWHYGDPLAEQRRLDRGDGVVDLSNRDVLTLEGPDRTRYLDLISTGRCADLKPGEAACAYLLDPQGHITYDLHVVATEDTLWLWTEPGRGAPLAAWLEQRKFRLNVVASHRPDIALVWRADPPARLADPTAGPVGATVSPTGRSPAATPGLSSPGSRSPAASPGLSSPGSRPDPWPVRRGPDSLGGAEWFVPRSDLAAVLATASPAGTWAWEARRIAAGVPRIGVDTDERTIPNELGVPSAAVVLDKGCYPGQETVARVHNLGRPPRRLVRLHLDGSAETFVAPQTPLHLIAAAQPLPASPAALTDSGAAVQRQDTVLPHKELVDGRESDPGAVPQLEGVDRPHQELAANGPAGHPVGYLGTMAYHWEDGPIALALVRRDLRDDSYLVAGSVAASIEPLVAADAGLHIRSDRPLLKLKPNRRGLLR